MTGRPVFTDRKRYDRPKRKTWSGDYGVNHPTKVPAGERAEFPGWKHEFVIVPVLQAFFPSVTMTVADPETKLRLRRSRGVFFAGDRRQPAE